MDDDDPVTLIRPATVRFLVICIPPEVTIEESVDASRTTIDLLKVAMLLTNNAFPIPTPPPITKAPVVALVESIVEFTLI